MKRSTWPENAESVIADKTLASCIGFLAHNMVGQPLSSVATEAACAMFDVSAMLCLMDTATLFDDRNAPVSATVQQVLYRRAMLHLEAGQGVGLTGKTWGPLAYEVAYLMERESAWRVPLEDAVIEICRDDPSPGVDRAGLQFAFRRFAEAHGFDCGFTFHDLYAPDNLAVTIGLADHLASLFKNS